MIGFFIHGFYVEMSSFHQFLSLIVKVNEFFMGSYYTMHVYMA